MSLTVSVLQGGTNSHATSSEEVNALATDTNAPGVIGVITNTSGVAPATGAFAVNAQGTPNATVAVSSGVCYVTGTPTSGNSQLVRVKNSASANVTIAANATGGTRYDFVYVKVDPDKLKDPALDASDVATLVTSRSTSATTDNGTPPTYGTLIAVVTVANGFSTITNSNIADKRVRTGFMGNWIDVNGNEIAKSSATASAVNEITFTNAATGNGPTISATGDDTNIDINLAPKGTGQFKIGGNAVSAGAWTAYTPTWTNLTVGNGTVTAAYTQIGKTVMGKIHIAAGSTSSITGSVPTFTLPVTAATFGSNNPNIVIGQGWYQDAGVAYYALTVGFNTATTGRWFALGASGTYATGNDPSATVPGTFGSSDTLSLYFIYEAA